MAEKIFGIHAVQSVLARSPERVQELYVQAGRLDKRVQEVLDLAKAAKVHVIQRARPELDAMVEGRHQGLVALVEAAASFRKKIFWIWWWRREARHWCWCSMALPTLII